MGVRRDIVQASGLPPTNLGQVFFVSATSGSMWNELNYRYPANQYGVARVYSSMTDAIAQCTAGNGDIIMMATDYTTQLTATELLNAETKEIAIMPLGQKFDGLYFSNKATAALPQTNSATLFTINGKVQVISLVGTVTTAIQDQACTVQLSVFNGAGKTTTITGATNVANNPVGAFWYNSNTTVATLIGIGQGVLRTGLTAGLMLGSGLILGPGATNAGQLRIKTSASNSGSVKWRVTYRPLEAGAIIF